MENELQKTVTKITDEKRDFMTDTQQPVELDRMELKKYIEFVVRGARTNIARPGEEDKTGMIQK
jgi:hypothetical protein